MPMKDAACRAIQADINQYAVTWGSPKLRAAVAKRTSEYNRIPTGADEHVTVCCGATEAMIAALLAVLDPGDEVIIFEPFYENYGPDCILSGAVPRMVRLHAPDWSIDERELRAAFNAKTRAIIVNTPHNPTGKVFSRAELELVAVLCIERDCLAITDEIYEYILFDRTEHISIATLPGMLERTITISGLSKTWSATGWRIGWCIAPVPLTGAIRKVHDFLTVGAAAPLQEAGAVALGFPEAYYETLAVDYLARRDLLLHGLRGVGFQCEAPRGAYYILADGAGLGCSDDTAFARRLIETVGVGAVPGSSFFSRPELGRTLLRFAFPKTEATLHEAVARLQRGLAH
jgi:aminotransferase